MNKPALVTLSDGHLMPQLGLGVWKTGTTWSALLCRPHSKPVTG